LRTVRPLAARIACDAADGLPAGGQAGDRRRRRPTVAALRAEGHRMTVMACRTTGCEISRPGQPACVVPVSHDPEPRLYALTTAMVDAWPGLMHPGT